MPPPSTRLVIACAPLLLVLACTDGGDAAGAGDEVGADGTAERLGAPLLEPHPWSLDETQRWRQRQRVPLALAEATWPAAVSSPVMVATADGATTFVWRRWDESGAAMLVGARLRPDGRWDEAQIIDRATRLIEHVELAEGPGGSVAAVWTNDGGSARFALYRPGAGWSPVEHVYDDVPFAHDMPRVVVDRSGAATVAWLRGRAAAVWARHRLADGTWEEPVLLEATDGRNTVLDARRLPLVVDRAGVVTAAWHRSDESGRAHVWASRFTPGAGWSAPEELSTTEGYSPRLVVDRTGEVHSLWTMHHDLGIYSRVWRRYHDGAWTPPVVIDDGPWLHDHVSTAIDGTGAITLLAVDERQFDWSLFARRYEPDAGWSDWEVLDPPRHLSMPYPTFGAAPGGEVYVVWRQVIDDGDAVVWKRFVPGAGWTPQRTIAANAERPFTMDMPVLAVRADGSVLLAWHANDHPDTQEGHGWLETMIYR